MSEPPVELPSKLVTHVFEQKGGGNEGIGMKRLLNILGTVIGLLVCVVVILFLVGLIVGMLGGKL